VWTISIILLQILLVFKAVMLGYLQVIYNKYYIKNYQKIINKGEWYYKGNSATLISTFGTCSC